MKSFLIAGLATLGAWFAFHIFPWKFFTIAFGVGGMAVTWAMVLCVGVFLFAFNSVGAKKSRR